jgi:hypothetical protein
VSHAIAVRVVVRVARICLSFFPGSASVPEQLLPCFVRNHCDSGRVGSMHR